MKILVTGGAGFIGSHLLEALLQLGREVVILDNFNDFYNPEIKRRNVQEARKSGDFVVEEVDLLDAVQMHRVFEKHEPQQIVHLAAWAGVRPSLERPALYCDVNVTGTVRLLELARKTKVERFVFGSSSSVYGVNSKVPFHEDDSLHTPVSPYAATKRAGELLCYTYHHNYQLPIVCLRFFTVYGPRQRPEMAIHKFSRKIRQGDPIEVYHQGKSERDYTYVDDIVSGVLAALERPLTFQIFNLGNSRTTKVLDLVRMIEAALEKKAKIQLQDAQLGDVPITFADIDKAKKMLGYFPQTPIDEGIQKFVEWFLKNA